MLGGPGELAVILSIYPMIGVELTSGCDYIKQYEFYYVADQLRHWLVTLYIACIFYIVHNFWYVCKISTFISVLVLL